jgi:ferrous iron transport protein B
LVKIQPHIALVGNPNCGKSTLFNRLTGMRQTTSNLPGTTVEQKSGQWKVGNTEFRLHDLPGIYSLFTHSDEETIVVDHLLGASGYHKPDRIIFLLDAANLRRNLLLFDQVSEMGIPMVLALTMADTATRRGISIDTKILSEKLGSPVCILNPRTGEGLDVLRDIVSTEPDVQPPANAESIEKLVAFRAGEKIPGLSAETLYRYKKIETVVSAAVTKKETGRRSLTRKLDNIFTHPVWGFCVFACIMLTIFQGVFTLADYPMTWIENGFGWLGIWLQAQLPDNFFSNLLIGGIIPGLSGVLVFLPQIAILFFFISLLEDSGYMVRASFITDKLMQRIGLNGRSVIPLIGGFACAIPSIMATRSIKNRSERIATMFVIPLMSCSARLPVYVLLVSLAVPAGTRVGPIGMQSLVMTLAYFSGIIMAVIMARIIKLLRKSSERSEFVMELPPYQLPRLQTVWSNVKYKSGSFVSEAGKVIMIISLCLWFLASYGPGDSMQLAEKRVREEAAAQQHDPQETKTVVAAARLQASYAGIMGQWIEPAIEPLGYDWKTGIALISSFAAREVFVGTMSTLFQSEDAEQVEGIRQKMMKAKDPETGKPLYGAPYAYSLIIFYAFALQCMSTLAVMKRETGSWRLPILQFVLFGAIAYVAAFGIYRLALLF